MTRQLIASLLLGAVGLFGATGCALTCEDWESHSEILESWVGVDIVSFERTSEIRPFDSRELAGGRFEYSYLVSDMTINGIRYRCVDRLIADAGTGKIIDWASEGECAGRCRR
jgi:hypothetical protein